MRALSLSPVLSVALLALSLAGCDSGETATAGSGGAGAGSTSGAGASGGSGGSTGPVIGIDATVTAFDKTHVYFTGDDNKREVDAAASFPAEGTYQSIILHLALDCPQGGCDSWDRFGSLGLVAEKGQDGEPDKVIEIGRFITPYKVKGAWDFDVTDLRPLLSGAVTLRTFIDTWVGPGSVYGAGWLVSASFEMKGGVPAKAPVAVVPVWTRSYLTYGDPAKTIESSAVPHDVALPAGSSYALRTFVTGHGQGNAGNCAEFCKRTHTLTVGGTAHEEPIWRTDCATTGVPGQQGSWKYSRAGWCPGADVRAWTVDITADVGGAASTMIGYGVDDYENTCRPDAATCSGCTLGTDCPYDGGAHTEPNYQLSTLLIAYE